ncbi:hypothetical protein CHS0354_001907 [Potamilus streckersoni]|uniref:Mitochondrial ribosomal protein S28 n=1 Tax=Potamilus streckersoni TaxID=2493646 RepID=A0AAE0SB66_9BIVA|nr:hypothetical protein CHS0354_001907 [Potamilus streckersoni]
MSAAMIVVCRSVVRRNVLKCENYRTWMDRSRCFSCTGIRTNPREAKSTSESKDSSGISGLMRVLQKLKVDQETPEVAPTKHENESFASMLRKSKLMQIGKPEGSIITGDVIDVVGDDLYIDFGGKFHCVCRRPQYKAEKYRRGARVKLQLNDLEMSSAFLGSPKHVTLLEADCTLLGLHRWEEYLKDQPKKHKEKESSLAQRLIEKKLDQSS